MTRVVDLKKEEGFIPQYVELRNGYAKLLLTDPVTIDETRQWLNTANVEVRCLVDGSVLIGVAVLYLDKSGEITFFARQVGKGTGTNLIAVIEEVAKKRKLDCIWAWVLKDNMLAQKAFEKGGFVRRGTSEKHYDGAVKQGFEYKKHLNY